MKNLRIFTGVVLIIFAVVVIYSFNQAPSFGYQIFNKTLDHMVWNLMGIGTTFFCLAVALVLFLGKSQKIFAFGAAGFIFMMSGFVYSILLPVIFS